MSLVDRVAERATRPREASHPVHEERGTWFPPTQFDYLGYVGSPNTAGVDVSTSTALENVAVWACQRVLVSTISMLPVDVIRTQGKMKSAVTPLPPMVRSPSGTVSRRGWVAQCIRSLVGSGNIYGNVVASDTLARPIQIETISPDQVTWRCEQGGEAPYVNGKRRDIWPLGDFWHVPASQFLMPGSREAMNPTQFAKTSIGTGIAAERMGANFFRDGLSPTAIVKSGVALDATQAAGIKQAIRGLSGSNRDALVVGKDLDITPWSANLTDSQFIELLQFEVLQACRVYGVPPSMAYAAVTGQSITYANIGQSDMQFLKYSIHDWLVDFEDAWSDLIAIPHSVQFNVDAVLRMDALSRVEWQTARLRNKTMTVNEARAENGDDPFPDAANDLPGIPGGWDAGSKITDSVSAPVDTGGSNA